MHIKKAVYNYKQEADKAVREHDMLCNIMSKVPTKLTEIHNIYTFDAYGDATITYKVNSFEECVEIFNQFSKDSILPTYVCDKRCIVPTIKIAKTKASNMVNTGYSETIKEIEPIYASATDRGLSATEEHAAIEDMKYEYQFYVKLSDYTVNIECRIDNPNFKIFSHFQRFSGGHAMYYNYKN